jgi:ABC-type long-subunit fatty acid transport system fused permease/ATPase subunit
MAEIYKMLLDFTIWPILISILIYLWKDLVNRVKNIENRSMRIEKDIVRLSTLIENLGG